MKLGEEIKEDSAFKQEKAFTRRMINRYIDKGVHDPQRLQNLYLQAKYYKISDEFPKELWDKVEFNLNPPKIKKNGFRTKNGRKAKTNTTPRKGAKNSAFNNGGEWGF